MRPTDDGKYIVELTDDNYASNSLERFMTRRLRRDVFTELAAQPHDPSERYNILIFGSAVPQRFRPKEGYEGRRLARDLDIAVAMKNPASPRVSKEEKIRIGQYILDAVTATGAEMVGEEKDGIRGYSGFHITKTYTPDEVRRALEGKREQNDVTIPDKPLQVPLEISQVYERSSMLPLIAFGENGLCHEDLREVIACKLPRLTASIPKDSLSKQRGVSIFQVKDLLDLYNVFDAYKEDLKPNASVIRAMAIVAMNAEPDSVKTLANVEPTAENIAKYSKALNIEPIMMKHICESVRDDLKEIFPHKIHADLPAKFAGELSLSLKEYNFMMALEGFERLPGDINIVRRIDNPAVKPELVLDTETQARFPKLSENIKHHVFLNNKVISARTQQSVDF